MDLGITLTGNKIKGITKAIKSQENIHQEKEGFFDDFFDPLMKMC